MQTGKRLDSIDTIRGITMVSMILYHFCWDLKYLDGFSMDWYGKLGSHLWQQSICWAFILIAGFCFHLAKRPLRNGALVFVCGVIVTCVTLLALPEAPVLFGVLTMTGSSIILMSVVKLIFKEKTRYPYAMLFVSVLLFAITKPINYGYLNLFVKNVQLPAALYAGGGADGMGNGFLTYLGIMQDGFYSSDYFSLMPWFFLFLTGYFLYYILENSFESQLFKIKLPFFTWFGRHSLIVYMVHQVILYGISVIIYYGRQMI